MRESAGYPARSSDTDPLVVLASDGRKVVLRDRSKTPIGARKVTMSQDVAMQMVTARLSATGLKNLPINALERRGILDAVSLRRITESELVKNCGLSEEEAQKVKRAFPLQKAGEHDTCSCGLQRSIERQAITGILAARGLKNLQINALERHGILDYSSLRQITDLELMKLCGLTVEEAQKVKSAFA